jgi:hypothetical protein
VMVQTPLIKFDFSLIDCSAIMNFSGADFANPDRFKKYRIQIWSHIETMISSNELKTVSQVWSELEFNDPASYQRLNPIHEKFLIPIEPEADSYVLQLIFKYPSLINYRRGSYTRPPADPYLIYYAKKYGVPIITDEKPLAERTGDRKTRWLKIPDICAAEGMKDQCVSLEKFLKTEGIIP